MKKLLQPAFMVCLAVIAFSCNKPEDIPKESTYTFTNQTGERVTLDIYNNKDDYSQEKNRLQRYGIEPNGSQKVRLDVARKYWVDWFTENYSYSNWQSIRSSHNRSSPTPELGVAAVDDAFVLSPSVRDTTRSILITDAGVSSTWQGYVATPSAVAGTHQFVFRKDFSGTYTYTDAGGTKSNTTFEFYVGATSTGLGVQQRFTMNIVNMPLTSTLFQITCTPGNMLSPHTGRDTMLVRFLNFSGVPEFAIIRQ